ncbi:MAG: hypothetical protein AAF620_16220 [Bacteroidota bacterium]
MKKERPPIEEIDISWIDKKQKEFPEMTDYELSLQMGREREYIGGIRTGRNLSKIAKAALWHIFKRYEKEFNK